MPSPVSNTTVWQTWSAHKRRRDWFILLNMVKDDDELSHDDRMSRSRVQSHWKGKHWSRLPASVDWWVRDMITMRTTDRCNYDFPKYIHIFHMKSYFFIHTLWIYTYKIHRWRNWSIATSQHTSHGSVTATNWKPVLPLSYPRSRYIKHSNGKSVLQWLPDLVGHVTWTRGWAAATSEHTRDSSVTASE